MGSWQKVDFAPAGLRPGPAPSGQAHEWRHEGQSKSAVAGARVASRKVLMQTGTVKAASSLPIPATKAGSEAAAGAVTGQHLIGRETGADLRICEPELQALHAWHASIVVLAKAGSIPASNSSMHITHISRPACFWIV